MLKYQWTMTTIQCHSDLEFLQNVVKEVQPEFGAMDTETNGLHIINNTPFVFQFGFLDPKHKRGFTFAIDLENNSKEFVEEVLNYWETIAHSLKIYMGHNIKFDLHMMTNIGHPYVDSNLTDTMFWIRYGHDALHPEEGGPMLGLKEYATKYIDRNAKLHEHKLKKEQSDIAKMYNNRLKNMLNKAQIKPMTGYKSFTLKLFNDLFNNCIFEISDLPEEIREVYNDWKTSLPLYLQHKVQSVVESNMIRYNDLNRENLITYSHYDIIYTLEIFASLVHVIKNRHQEEAIKIENACIIPWYKMERTGFKADKEYLETCRKNLKQYIIERRKEFYELTEEKIGVGQHPAIKRILKDKYGLEVSSTGNEKLELIKNKMLNNHEIVRFIDLLQELRTLEKWYSVYILRFQKELTFNDKLYATINQVGTVSGRVTSDFQQFPKKGIKTKDGKELFHPRRVIYTDTALVYLDYSQIELRFQALYTILVGNPDYNMCRAYMPYDCYRIPETGAQFKGIQFDYNNPEHIKNYTKFKWYHNEDDTEWHPVDVHGATTTAATGKYPGDEDWDILRRDVGKRVNFAKNYGAELPRIKQMFPDKTHEECVKINDAYYKAFPGVKEYHKYCSVRASTYSNTTNLLGVKYYNVSGHKLKNLLIQGSAAFFLKQKIIELNKFCEENNIKTKFQMQIHDELSWEYDPQDPPEIFFKFKEIMEDWEETKIPIIADMEISTTSWADKKEIETLEQLKGELL